jgi:hypothetical protein
MTENSSPFQKVDASINQICDTLKLTPFVRTECIKVSNDVTPKEGADMAPSIANAIACAIVSIVHEDAKRKGRVAQHLPDKAIGNVFGLSGVSVVYNKRLINSVRSGNSKKMAEISG